MPLVGPMPGAGHVVIPGIPGTCGLAVAPALTGVTGTAGTRTHDLSPPSPVPVSPGPQSEGSVTGRPVLRTGPQALSQKSVRPHPVRASRRVSSDQPFTELDIPLYLVPLIIARMIWPLGERVYRISVIRTKQHYYTIRVRTARPDMKSQKKSQKKSRETKAPPECGCGWSGKER